MRARDLPPDLPAFTRQPLQADQICESPIAPARIIFLGPTGVKIGGHFGGNLICRGTIHPPVSTRYDPGFSENNVPTLGKESAEEEAEWQGHPGG
jgi:hypothetical protein